MNTMTTNEQRGITTRTVGADGLVVTCHRAIGADGTLTGCAGGLSVKRMLLALEAGTPRSRLVSRPAAPGMKLAWSREPPVIGRVAAVAALPSHPALGSEKER